MLAVDSVAGGGAGPVTFPESSRHRGHRDLNISYENLLDLESRPDIAGIQKAKDKLLDVENISIASGNGGAEALIWDEFTGLLWPQNMRCSTPMCTGSGRIEQFMSWLGTFRYFWTVPFLSDADQTHIQHQQEDLIQS